MRISLLFLVLLPCFAFGQKIDYLYREPIPIRDTIDVLFSWMIGDSVEMDRVGWCDCSGNRVPAIKDQKWGSQVVYSRCIWYDREKGRLPDEFVIIQIDGFPSIEWVPDE